MAIGFGSYHWCLHCWYLFEFVYLYMSQVYYFDGELECFYKEHLYYGVIAITVSVVVLISSMLYVLAISFNFFEVSPSQYIYWVNIVYFNTETDPLQDVISFGIKVKYHWWSGFDLFRRLIFFLVCLIFENFISEYTQVSVWY